MAYAPNIVQLSLFRGVGRKKRLTPFVITSCDIRLRGEMRFIEEQHLNIFLGLQLENLGGDLLDFRKLLLLCWSCHRDTFLRALERKALLFNYPPRSVVAERDPGFLPVLGYEGLDRPDLLAQP